MNPITLTYQLVTNHTKTLPQLIHRSLGQSYLFFLLYYTLLALILTGVFSLTTLPQLLTTTRTIITDLETNYPSSLIITISDNTLTTNLPTPIEIPLTPDPILESFTHLAIIDPDIYPRAIEDKNTLLLASQNSFALILDPINRTSRIIPYEQLGQDIFISHTSLTSFTTQALSLVNTLAPYLPLFIFLGILISLHISRLIFLLFYTIATYSIGQLLKRDYGYKAYFNLGLHTLVLTEIIYQLQLLVYPALSSLVYSLTFLAITTLATLSLPKHAQKKQS